MIAGSKDRCLTAWPLPNLHPIITTLAPADKPASTRLSIVVAPLTDISKHVINPQIMWGARRLLMCALGDSFPHQ